jgi:hypothetical protein
MNAETNIQITHGADQNRSKLQHKHLLATCSGCKLFIGVLFQPHVHVLL